MRAVHPFDSQYQASFSGEPVLTDPLAALEQLPDAVCADEQTLPGLLALLAHREEPVEVRLRALQVLQAASFSVVAFAKCRRQYVAGLRKVAGDPDPEIRQTVLGILSRQKDGFAQEKLLTGLREPAKALVPPEKALQLLAYDPHADGFEEARKIVEKPPNEVAKREALRLLTADPESAPLLESVLRDKDAQADVRQVAATALNALNPDLLRKNAREILMDKQEYPEIQATSLTALTAFGGQAIADDGALRERVKQLRDQDAGELQQTARQFLGKYEA
jgi:hypothetical protein